MSQSHDEAGHNNSQIELPTGVYPVSNVMFTILAAIIGFVPLVTYLRLVEYEGVTAQLLGGKTVADYFTFYKMAWTLILTGAGLLWFIVFRRAESCFYNKSIVIYAASTVLAAVFAPFTEIALWGDPQRHEGLFVHLAYMAIVFLFLNLTDNLKFLRRILGVFLVSSAILSLIGALQFFGHDYFIGPYGTGFLLPRRIAEVVATDSLFNRSVNGLRTIYLTFGNGNYTGIYMSMLFPLTLALFLGFSGTGKFFLLFLNALVYVNLLGSNARAAMGASAIAGLLTVLLFRHRLWAARKYIALLVLIYVIVPFVMDAYTLRNDLPRFFSTSVGRPVYSPSSIHGQFKDLKIDGSDATLVFDNYRLQLKYREGYLEFYDNNNELQPAQFVKTANASSAAGTPYQGSTRDKAFVSTEVEPSNKNAGDANSAVLSYRVLFPPGRLPGFIIHAWPEMSVVEVGRGGNSVRLAHTDKGFKLVSFTGKFVDAEEVEAWGFKDREGFASGRGYIWSRSLPLLKQTLLIGFGPDTFMFHFPNHDYLGKLRHWAGGLKMVLEKPHNLYLQIAINIGVIALIAMLIMWGGYLLESARLYFNCDFDNQLNVYGAAIFVAVFAYLVNAMFNDSIVGIAQVFWALLGMGFAVNRMLLREKADKDRETASSTAVSSQ